MYVYSILQYESPNILSLPQNYLYIISIDEIACVLQSPGMKKEMLWEEQHELDQQVSFLI